MKDTVIIGRKGLGKTTMALYVARVDAPYILIYDGCCQFQIFAAADNPKALQAVLAMKDEDGEPVNPVAYQPEGEAMDNFPAFSKACWSCQRRPMAIIVDEAGELQSPGMMEPNLSRLVRQAHRYNMCVIQTCHRPPDLHRRSWALGSRYIFFRTTDQNDLERIEKHCGPEVAAKVSQLERYHCVVWDEDAQTYEVWSDPGVWYVDIHGEQVQRASLGDGGSSAGEHGAQEPPTKFSSQELEEAYSDGTR